MTRIHNKFEELKEKGKAALVTYLTAGDPSLEATPDIIYKLEESGADIIELGVPFSDPMADGPTIQSERIRLVSERASGFIYLVSVTGVTGERPAMDYSLEPLVREIKNYTGLPVGIGFGVSTPDQAARIANFADAVIVGSALIRIIEKYGNNGKELFKEISGFISGLSKACYRDS